MTDYLWFLGVGLFLWALSKVFARVLDLFGALGERYAQQLYARRLDRYHAAADRERLMVKSIAEWRQR